MKAFSKLFQKIEQTTSTNAKVKALVEFFEEAPDPDKIWAIALFTHRRPKRTVSTTFLRLWAAELANIPDWLFENSYHIVGDLAETIALVLPVNKVSVDKPLAQWITEIAALKNEPEEVKKEYIIEAWNALDKNQRFLFNKLITGGFRVGISQRLITKALSKYLEVDDSKIAHRLMGDWSPFDISFQDLMVSEDFKDNISRPYPFYLAYSVEKELEDLHPVEEWSAEWKWDGIRGQFIYRENEVFIWSRGEELVTDRFPELHTIPNGLEYDFVIDGEILAFYEGQPMNFQHLQKRIGRKSVGKKLIKDVPVVFMVYDLIEYKGEDIRQLPLKERRSLLNQLVKESNSENLILSEQVEFTEWSELRALIEEARARKTEGFMLKNLHSPYRDGRKKGDWWKWKVDPFTIDAVMIYAQRGHGRRANLFTDFTFALWDGDRLVTFAKAYSGLTDVEFQELSRFVRKNTIERFGPVHSVKADLVFELAFEGIQESKRHKSGIALRFPRILRWRKDKKASEANTLADIKTLLD
ncbi:ATP-dependent DNA ligase [Portibacter lacus]|uniref:DNA ligase (ATP) n=1 Tax=Portibacter lacus TaxID=1099794 RepID=A0AA37WHN7_9BACT|nr:ATP-dependent DNA ligase [Portibacter lacus]GLR18900.1 ATP-dependent DNA ligase [Portibacter lacus]